MNTKDALAIMNLNKLKELIEICSQADVSFSLNYNVTDNTFYVTIFEFPEKKTNWMSKSRTFNIAMDYAIEYVQTLL